MIEWLGWIGSIAFAISAAPQAWQSYKDGHSRGLNSLFLLTWLIGELCLIVKFGLNWYEWSMMFNYSFNLACLMVIIYYKMWPRPEPASEELEAIKWKSE